MVDIQKWLKGLLSAGQPTEPARPPGFPAELLAHHHEIEATRLPIVGGKVLDETPQDPTSSQLGGNPWWPADKDFPTDHNGRPLLHLIQINFAEVPPLEPFPEEGLLQFFIGTDDLSGCGFCDPDSPADFACIYHPESKSARLEDFSFLIALYESKSFCSPLQDPGRAFKVDWTKTTMTVDLSDFRFVKLLPGIAAKDDLIELYEETMDSPPIRLGGYPNFTQTDPRKYSGPAGIGTTNLLTVDTTDHIMWGDVGVAQFFIEEVDLKARDFSKVAYNWDCC